MKITLIAFCTIVLLACSENQNTPTSDFDVVILNGRVMDPETDFDGVRNVGIKDGMIFSITEEVISGTEVIDASGLVVAPGFIDTELTAPLTAARALIEAQTPMGRFGDCDDIAWPAVYLASDEAKFVTGQVLSPNGGYVMSQ